jgi:hypothetical protein
LDEAACLAKMDAGWKTQTFSMALMIAMAARTTRCLFRGTRYSSASYLRVVWLVVAVSNEIDVLLLEADGWCRWGLPISLIKEVVILFFSRKDDVLLNAEPH